MRYILDRRELLKTFGGGIAAFFSAVRGGTMAVAEEEVPEIWAGFGFYEPSGLFIQKGQTVRWVASNYGPIIDAFHPTNLNHELRIPENAKPFHSWTLVQHGRKYSQFEWTFDVEGTYDYFSRTFEPMGMVGRIVVGQPGGPAEQFPLGYGGREGRAVVFPAQAKILTALPSSEIVAKKSLPFPKNLVVRTFPYGDVR
jgi:plastocyanin